MEDIEKTREQFEELKSLGSLPESYVNKIDELFFEMQLEVLVYKTLSNELMSISKYREEIQKKAESEFQRIEGLKEEAQKKAMALREEINAADDKDEVRVSGLENKGKEVDEFVEGVEHEVNDLNKFTNKLKDYGNYASLIYSRIEKTYKDILEKENLLAELLGKVM